MKARLAGLLILPVIVALGCDTECDGDDDCGSCIGRVDTDEPFPFRQQWSGTTVVNDTELPARVSLELVGAVQKPASARNAAVQEFCDGRRQAWVRWTVEVGDTFRYELESYSIWNPGDAASAEDWSAVTASVSSLESPEDAWPSGCEGETNLDTHMFVRGDPDRLHVTMAWRRGQSETCKLPFLDFQVVIEE